MQLICGMHRSGTSLVARLAAGLGADFGDPSGFHPADQWNPQGYYEQTDILHLNQKLVNGPWGQLSYALLPSAATVVKRADRRADRLQGLGKKYAECTVKENRFCLTLDAWQNLGVAFPRVLIVFRDPNAVCLSLKRRNRLPCWIGMRLWLRHYQRLQVALQPGTAVTYLDYDQLVSDTGVDDGLDLIRRFFSLPESDEKHYAGLKASVRTGPAEEVDSSTMTTAVQAHYQQLKHYAQDANH